MPDFPSPPLSPRARRAVARATVGSNGSQGSDNPGAYRLRRDEKVAAGVRRVARARADDALEHLRGEATDDFATAVHEARKDLKKIRSVLRLVRDRLGDDVFSSENGRFRDAGRMLSAPRDAEVKLATLDGLRERYSDEVPADASDRLGAALEADRDAVAQSDDGSREAAREAIGLIEDGREQIDDWPLAGSGWKLVRGGLERSCRTGRKRFRETVADPSPEAVHEWRKRVKDLWYHLRLVRDAWRPVLGGLADEAHELADLLGDHHDLHVLATDAAGRAELHQDGGGVTALLELVERRQDELLELAIPIGERLYAEKPKIFIRRTRKYWRAWRPD
jgi:CHAD domain-containing protein